MRLEQTEDLAPLAGMARKASEDERRHAAHCRRLALAYGHAPPASDPDPTPEEFAPPAWTGRPKLLYEVVAACCVAETQSTSVLLALLAEAKDAELKGVLRELSHDEVEHARLGWACLARARQAGDVAFLGPVIPGMLGGNAGEELFRTPPEERNSPALVQHGVLPHRQKVELFVETAKTVIFPGFEQLGIDTGPARRWLRDALCR